MVLPSNVELPDQGDNIIRTKELNVKIDHKGLGHELFIAMRKHPDAIAQINAECEESDTFESLLKKCVRVALHLQKRGVSFEDTLSPCISNNSNSTVSIVAPLLIGAKIACMDPFMPENDIGEMIDLIKPKLIFIDEENEEKIENILRNLRLNAEIIVFGKTRKHTPFSELLQPFPKDEEENFLPFEFKDLSGTAVIVFSGGSTGVPKAICFSHFCVLSQLQRHVLSGRINTNFILYSSLSWVSTQMNILSSLISGNCRLICPEFDPAKTWKYLVKYDIKNMILPPNYALQFLRYGNPERLDTPNLKLFTITGGKVGPNHLLALKRLFLQPVLIISPYNLSKIYGPLLSYDNIELLMNKPGSSGLPSAGFYYKIIDPVTGNICGPNEKGELRLKSKFSLTHYYNNDCSECFDEDGFLKTGDIAHYDQDHFFYISDKIDDILQYESDTIPSSVLESILYQHPTVKIACVIAIHCDGEDIAIAVVVKEESAPDVTEDELIEFFNAKVENDLHRIRGGIIFVDESLIPYSSTGKIRKFLLSKLILEDLDDLDFSINVM